VNKVQRLVTVETLGRWNRELLDLIERIVKAGATFRSLGDSPAPPAIQSARPAATAAAG
jgi:hypothetical protein